MGSMLDIDDVCSGHPLAQKELDAMRKCLALIDDLTALSEADINSAIASLELNKSADSFFKTWAKNCGAPASVLKGHTVKMIIGIFN